MTPLPIRLVLDTNVVLDWLLFKDTACTLLAKAIESGQVRLLSNEACLHELEVVLSRSELCPSNSVAADLLENYGRLVLHMYPGPANVVLPVCSDPEDQKFLELAANGGAEALLSRDKALLKLSKRLVRTSLNFTVLTPREFNAWFIHRRSDARDHQEGAWKPD